MGNYLNNSGLRPSLLDIALSYNNGKQGEVKQKTRVVVNTNRIWYGVNSTASAFLATAYDEQGKEVDSMRGYFLEPQTKYEKAKTAGGKMAIMSGEYNIIPNAEMLKKINEQRKKNNKIPEDGLQFQWYIDTPPGRSCIAIHGGKTWKNTKGCFIPGDTIELSADGKDYEIYDRGKKKELFDFFEKYGEGGIKINVGPHFEELYK
ncbi:MAG: hypothetical protein J6J37_01240 [Bacteroidaceae bacterium]|nr:hypothetical protein [Bacteroidaceae bacterium]